MSGFMHKVLFLYVYPTAWHQPSKVIRACKGISQLFSSCSASLLQLPSKGLNRAGDANKATLALPVVIQSSHFVVPTENSPVIWNVCAVKYR